jgi:hypothetical protein
MMNMLLACSFGCSKFSHTNFVTASFGLDLTSYIESKKSEYSDGLLQVFSVAESDALYQKLFSGGFLIEQVGIECGSHNFSVSKYGEIRYRIVGEKFDGYVPVIFYLPRDRQLCFAYATGLGG